MQLGLGQKGGAHDLEVVFEMNMSDPPQVVGRTQSQRHNLKFLTPHSANDDDSLTRLKREARAAAALEHPNICQVHEIGHADGLTFIVMSYLKGRTLEDRLASEGPLPTGEALGIAKEVGDALSRAHAAGVVHRDIKPANIMLTDGGHAVVMDFGLVKDADLTRMTRTGTTLGTAAYMSPEQMQGQSVDAKADTWALGVVIYEMLAGRLPVRRRQPPRGRLCRSAQGARAADPNQAGRPAGLRKGD